MNINRKLNIYLNEIYQHNTHSIMYNGLNGVFQLFDQSITLQDINDTNVEKQALSLAVTSRNSTRSKEPAKSNSTSRTTWAEIHVI